MKIRCDLKIQNLNQAPGQEKVHKQCMLGLYRPRPDDDYNSCSSSLGNEIILTIEAKLVNLKYKLRRVDTHTKFINEGKATLKLVDENVYLLLSNCPALTLINFVSFLRVKLASNDGNNNSKKSAATNNKENSNPAAAKSVVGKSYANRLLDRLECNLGPSHLKNISPLCEKDLNVLAKRRPNETSRMESPVLARTAPSNVSKPKIFEKQTSFSSLVQLTDDQKHVLNVIKAGKNVFFTGSGGTGKSFLINLARKCFPNESCTVTASTGCAAALIGGITLHAFAGFTLGANDNEHTDADERLRQVVSRIVNSKEKLNNWKRCRQLIIDEISMIDAEYFDTLEAVARSVKNSDLPFGGIQLIVCGDFLQLPPVSKRSAEKKKFCFQAKSWPDCIETVVQLTQIQRQKDVAFIELLEEIRFGKCSKRTLDLLEKSKLTQFADTSILPTRLCTHKDDVELINRKELDSLLETGPAHTYRSIDEGDHYKSSSSTSSSSLSKLLNLLSPARDELQLKVGAQVMLIKNLDVAGGLVNGSRGCVVGFEAESRSACPIVRFMNGLEVPVRYDQWSFKMNAAGATVTRRQLPLQLAWAMSIHKSQGMTLDCVEISLSRVFECGQAYVALSRAKSLASVKIVDFDAGSIRANEVVVKFYREIGGGHNFFANRLDFD